MAGRKRKLDAKPAEGSQRRRQQQQPQQPSQQPEEEEKPNPIPEAQAQEDAADEVEAAEDQENEAPEDQENDAVEEEEDEEEDEGDDPDEEAEADDVGKGGEKELDAIQPQNAYSSSPASAPADPSVDGGGDEDEEPIQSLLEPFSKEQLLGLLQEAALTHPDVAERVRKVADEDPAQRKIFVHGLGWDTNAETLAAVFGQYGEIEDCKAVADKISGKSKGYGFILFKTRKGARKALEQPQKKIGSRMTACQLASTGPVAPAAASSAPPAGPGQQQQPLPEYNQKKIYVSNVSADLDPQKLLAFFAKFGEIEEGPLGLDKQTGKPKGFCLFVYRNSESAKKALKEPHKNFEGHILHCQKAVDGPKAGKSQQPYHNNNSHNANFQRNRNLHHFNGPAAPAGHTPAHLMAPSAPGMGTSQAGPTLNPAAVGQALTALLATPGGVGVGVGLNNLFGTLAPAGVNQPVPGAVHGMQGGYANQNAVPSNVSPGLMSVYGAGQAGYPNQQMVQGNTARSQHSAGHFGSGAPYMGH